MPLLSATDVAYPFIKVEIVPPPAPVLSRSPGVIAVVGKTPAGADGGSAPLNAPREVSSPADAVDLFAKRNAAGAAVDTTLSASLKLAFQQDPQPSKVYGVRVDDDKYADALATLEGIDDITFVALAHEYSIDPLLELKAHVENCSAAGNKRIGVVMVDPTRARGQTWAADTIGSLTGAGKVLRSDVSRMIVVAGRAPDDATAPDFAVAAMAAIAGKPPEVSPVLKQVRGTAIPPELAFSPSEIKALSQEGIIPIIDPALIAGEGQFMADGVLFTSDATRPYVDIVRVLDDLEFRLRAGLIGTIGDARISREGLILVKATADGILGPLQRRGMIDDYKVTIPLLDRLAIPEAARTAADVAEITSARASRAVDMTVVTVYAAQIHQLGVKLRMVYA